MSVTGLLLNHWYVYIPHFSLKTLSLPFGYDMKYCYIGRSHDYSCLELIKINF